MVNKAILVGRLGRDPETRTSQAGKVVCKFSLATDTGFGNNRKTDWHNIVCFDRQADFAKSYLRKGSLVYIEGRISYSEYEKDGVKQRTTEILANTIQSLGKNESGGAGGNFNPDVYDSPSYGNTSSYSSSAPAAESAAPADNFGDDGISNDDLPF